MKRGFTHPKRAGALQQCARSYGRVIAVARAPRDAGGVDLARAGELRRRCGDHDRRHAHGRPRRSRQGERHDCGAVVADPQGGRRDSRAGSRRHFERDERASTRVEARDARVDVGRHGVAVSVGVRASVAGGRVNGDRKRELLLRDGAPRFRTLCRRRLPARRRRARRLDPRRRRGFEGRQPTFGRPVERCAWTGRHHPEHGGRSRHRETRPSRRAERRDRDGDLDIDRRRRDGSRR